MPQRGIISGLHSSIFPCIEAGHLARPKDGESPMRTLFLAAFAALSLTAGIAPMAHAYTTGFVNNAYQSGEHDNFDYGPGNTGAIGGN
jgi:hypothetical protein